MKNKNDELLFIKCLFVFCIIWSILGVWIYSYSQKQKTLQIPNSVQDYEEVYYGLKPKYITTPRLKVVYTAGLAISTNDSGNIIYIPYLKDNKNAVVRFMSWGVSDKEMSLDNLDKIILDKIINDWEGLDNSVDTNFVFTGNIQ